MPIRPIEIQMSIERTTDATLIQQQHNNRNANEQVQFLDHMTKNIKLQSESVNKKDKTEFHEYKYDAKEKGNSEYQAYDKNGRNKNQKDKKDPQKENKKQEDQKQNREQEIKNFDIKI